MLKELPNRFELDPNALEVGDRFFCIDRTFNWSQKLVEFVVEKVSSQYIEAKSLTKGEKDFRIIKNLKNYRCCIYGPKSEAVRGFKIEISVTNLLREIQAKGLETLTPNLEKALSEWESARTKNQESVKKTKDFERK